MKRLLTFLLYGLALFLLVPGMALAQGGTITGQVIDGDTAEPLPGASVLVVGEGTGAAADADGQYTIEGVPPGDYRLRASFIGYESETVAVTVNEGETVQQDFSLGTDLANLEEVVVTGYSTQQRRNLSSSISQVDAEEINAVPATSVDAVLQGKAAGVTVLQSSGDPSSGVSVRVRGSTSINGSNQPLYVIDGVPVSSGDFSQIDKGNQGLNALGTVDPSNIASIEVLKDAAATAIYGTRAANGVVLITTKRGQAGGTRVNFETSLGASYYDESQTGFGLLSGPEYIRLRNEGVRNQGLDQSLSDAFFNGGLFPGTRAFPYGNPDEQQTYNHLENVQETGVVQKYTLNINGGDEQTRFAVSGSFFDDQGAVIEDGFRRLNGRVNVDHNWSERATLTANASYNRSTAQRIGNDNFIYGVLTNALTASPAQPLRDSLGQYNFAAGAFENPVAIAQVDNESVTTKFLGNVAFDYDFLPQLRGRISAGLDRFDIKEDQYAPRFTGQGSPAGSAISSGVNNQTWIVEGTLNYNQTFSDVSDVSLLGGASIQEEVLDELFASGDNFPTDATRRLDAAANTDSESFRTRNTLVSAFGTGEYNYDSKYLFTVTGRVDGSSRFSEDNQFAFFPAFSAGWNAHRESFLEGASWLNQLKLRGSFGYSGQQEIGNFPFQALFGTGSSYAGTSGLTPSQLGNPDLTWETTRQANVGVDASLFDGRVSSSLDLYQKDSEDLLLNVPVPSTTGYTTLDQNVGLIQNRGIEFQLTTVNVRSDAFQWSTTLNLSSNQNEVKELDEPYSTGFASRVQEGEPLGSFYGYSVDRLFQVEDAQGEGAIFTDTNGDGVVNAEDDSEFAFQSGSTAPGDIKFNDLNDDGVINSLDREIIGDANPDLFGGFTNNFSFKGFELSAFLQFSLGNDVYNSTAEFIEQSAIASGYSTSDDLVDRWTPENPNADIPRLTYNDPNSNDRTSDRFIEDGSYLRLKTLTLAYNVPSSLIESISMRNVRIYATGKNLLTFTGYDGLDPEVSTFDRSNTSFGTAFFTTPQRTILTFGVQLGL